MNDTPKIFSDASDDDLPDDLLLLAEQLSADAEHLASVYGPRETLRSGEFHPATTPVRPSTRHKIFGRIAAAAILFSVGVGTWQGAKFLTKSPEVHHERTVATSDSRTNDVDSRTNISRTNILDERVSVGYFQNLTSPEQEGLLDLMETVGEPASSLSI